MSLKDHLSTFGVVAGSLAALAGATYLATRSSSLSEVSRDELQSFRDELSKAVQRRDEWLLKFRVRAESDVVRGLNDRLMKDVTPTFTVLEHRIAERGSPDDVELVTAIKQGFSGSNLGISLL